MTDYPEAFESLNRKLDNVTGELVNMRRSVNVIEQNTEIDVLDENGLPVSMKTNELMKHVYEHIRPHGHIDAKFKKCQDDHSAINVFSKFNKSANVYISTLKIFIYAILTFAVLWGFYDNMKRDQKEDQMNKKLEQLEKLIK